MPQRLEEKIVLKCLCCEKKSFEKGFKIKLFTEINRGLMPEKSKEIIGLQL